MNPAGVISVAMSGANPKNFALTMVAATSIAQEQLDGRRTAVAVAAYVLIGSMSVLPALVVHLVAPERAARSLDSVKDFMVANNSVIMMVILLLIGTNILGAGIGGLGS